MTNHSSPVLELPGLGVPQLERDGHGGGDDVAAAERREQRRQHRHLPAHIVHIHQLGTRVIGVIIFFAQLPSYSTKCKLIQFTISICQ